VKGTSSYITMALGDAGQPARVRVSLYLDERAAIEHYDDTPTHQPFLDIDHGDVHITIHPANREMVTPAEVATARRLLTCVAAYTAEIERLADSDSGTSETPAA
jgi:hypothetical protein